MDKISVKDVLASVGENTNPARDILGIPSSGVEAKNAEGEDIVVNTAEFQLTKDYFENLGLIMQDYLASTTLGDLARKEKADLVDVVLNNNNTNSNNNRSNNTAIAGLGAIDQ